MRWRQADAWRLYNHVNFFGQDIAWNQQIIKRRPCSSPSTRVDVWYYQEPQFRMILESFTLWWAPTQFLRLIYWHCQFQAEFCNPGLLGKAIAESYICYFLTYNQMIITYFARFTKHLYWKVGPLTHPSVRSNWANHGRLRYALKSVIILTTA